jgi:hypothetical protein
LPTAVPWLLRTKTAVQPESQKVVSVPGRTTCGLAAQAGLMQLRSTVQNREIMNRIEASL